MVILLLFLFPFIAWAADVDVKAEVSQYSLKAYQPITANVIVTHSKDQQIDENSFTLDGKPLKVELEKEVRFSDDQIISIYHFKLPPQAEGQYTLNPITLKIGDKSYKTEAVNYKIAATATQPFEEPLLELHVKIEAPEPLHPGQRLKLIYRYFYRGNIQMTKEELPLLHPKGFKKIGEEIVKDYEEENKSVREITLEVEADKPGEYTFPTSIIEAQALIPGQPPRQLQAKSDPITISVVPFPTDKQPITFEGAYGEFTIQTKLLSNDTVKVGDRLTLAIEIVGNEVSKVQLPDLFCLPGFSGMFTLDDLPITGKIDGDKKRFIIYLRPTNDAVKEIPPIALSYFDLVTETYSQTASKAISIQVKPVQNVLSNNANTFTQQKTTSQEDWTTLMRNVPAISVEQTYLLKVTDLHNLLFASWYVLLIFPAGIGALIGQIYLKRKK